MSLPIHGCGIIHSLITNTSPWVNISSRSDYNVLYYADHGTVCTDIEVKKRSGVQNGASRQRQSPPGAGARVCSDSRTVCRGVPVDRQWYRLGRRTRDRRRHRTGRVVARRRQLGARRLRPRRRPPRFWARRFWARGARVGSPPHRYAGPDATDQIRNPDQHHRRAVGNHRAVGNRLGGAEHRLNQQ